MGCSQAQLQLQGEFGIHPAIVTVGLPGCWQLQGLPLLMFSNKLCNHARYIIDLAMEGHHHGGRSRMGYKYSQVCVGNDVVPRVLT